MAEKKFYWLKLKENFFDEKHIKYLRKLPDGDKLVITYLKMQLKSLRTEGFIKYDKILPSNEEELAMILDEDVNIVKLTINALIQARAIEVLDDGSFYMLAMQELIGKEGESAERVRQFRKRQKILLQGNNDVTNCNTEIEKEKEMEKEKEILKCYEQNIGSISPATAELLLDYLKDMDYKLIIEAIKIATLANKRNGRYINGILKDWNKKGYKFLADIEQEKENKNTTETTEERVKRALGG